MKTSFRTLSLATIIGAVALTTSIAHANTAGGTCPTWKCGFNGTSETGIAQLNGWSLNGIQWNGIQWNGWSLNGKFLNGTLSNGVNKSEGPIVACDTDQAESCKPGVVAVTLPSGQRLVID